MFILSHAFYNSENFEILKGLKSYYRLFSI